MRTAILASLTIAATAAAQPGETPAPIVDRSIEPAIKLDPFATTERWGGAVRLTGLSGIGALPGRNVGVEVAGLVRRDELFVELALGRWKPENDYTVIATPTPVPLALDVWSLRGGWASMRMPLRAWVLAEVGEIAGANAMPGVISRMVMGKTPSDRRWSQVGAGLGVAWPMSNQARLVGNLELGVPLQRETVMLDDRTFEPDPLTARFSVGLEVGWR
ncbi:MAG TPA: hypothetical protein VGO00_05100 [Kofleriaceae bacterium]|jgi:hypothetical protein|nr:hypothetical protein [Kofleriaceae bacterium]